jgi:hypothetical protein
VLLPNPRAAGWGVEAVESEFFRFSELQGVVANLWQQDTGTWVKRPFLQRFAEL